MGDNLNVLGRDSLDKSNNTFKQHQDSGGDSNTVIFEHERSGPRERLALTGELKHSNSDIVLKEVMDLFSSGVQEVLLDFRSLFYVDTTGLQSLVRVYKHVQTNPALKFKILVKDGELKELLQVCRFDKFIDITNDTSVCDKAW